MPIYRQVQQRTDAWFRLRLGIPTASEFHRIVTPTGRLSAQNAAYMHRLLAEAMLGRSLADDDPRTEWMERGERIEEEAVKAYEMYRDMETQPGGFVTVDSGRYGCSPDRLVGTNGGAEIKAPAPNTHVGYLISPESMRQDKQPQMQGCLLVCDREVWDLVSYHPEMPPVILRVTRDEKYIATLRDALESFCDVMSETRAKLEALYGKFPEPRVFRDGGHCPVCRLQYEAQYIGTPCSRCAGLIVSEEDIAASAAVEEI